MNPIDTIQQASKQASQTGVSKLDKTIGLGEGIYNDLVTIYDAGKGAVAAEGALYEAHTSELGSQEQSIAAIEKYGTSEQRAESESIQSKLAFQSTKTRELSALANQASRNPDPTRVLGPTGSGSTSANQIVKAGAGAGRAFNYSGPCPTMTTGGADRLARDGSRCGRRAASVRPGGWWV